MQTASEVFVNVFKRTAAAINLDLTATTPQGVVDSFEANLSNDVQSLAAAVTLARSYSGASQIYTASKLWGSDFSDRAAAALALGLFSQSVSTILNPGNKSRRHHWAPVCFTKRFRKSSRERITRGQPISAYDPSHDEVREIRQVDLILPGRKGRRGYNDQSLEAFYSVLETGYTRVMTNEVEDTEQEGFVLSLFALAQLIRMPKPGYNPPHSSGEFAAASIELLEHRLLPTVHRLSDPVGFSVENYFRTYRTGGDVIHVAPVSRRVAVVFAANEVSRTNRDKTARGLSNRQHSAARRTETLVIGTPCYSPEESREEALTEDSKLVD